MSAHVPLPAAGRAEVIVSEQVVLGTAVLSPVRLTEIVAIPPAAYFVPEHATLAVVLAEVHAHGETPDVHPIDLRLRARGYIHGPDLISEVVDLAFAETDRVELHISVVIAADRARRARWDLEGRLHMLERARGYDA